MTSIHTDKLQFSRAQSTATSGVDIAMNHISPSSENEGATSPSTTSNDDEKCIDLGNNNEQVQDPIDITPLDLKQTDDRHNTEAAGQGGNGSSEGEHGSADEKSQNSTNHVKKIPLTKVQMVKNVFIISAGGMFLFSAYQGAANLQTSLNKEEGIGAWSLATIYLSVVISSMLLPDFVISRLGPGWTIPVCMSGYILYMAANLHAVKATMIPSSILLGLGAACVWSAQSSYLTQMGVWYAQLSGGGKDNAISLFFGIFYTFYQSGQIWGNMVSSLVFAPDLEPLCQNNSVCSNTSMITTMIQGNLSRPYVTMTNETMPRCGAVFCPEDALDTANKVKFEQPMKKIYTLCGTYIISGITGALFIAVFLDKITLESKDKNREKQRLSPRRFITTLRHLKNSHVQLLLAPITIYNGMEKAFISGDYTKAYVSCSLGIWNVGYMMICFGAVNAVISFSFGRIVQYVGHFPLFVLAFCTHGGVIIALLLWQPSPDQFVLFFGIAALWAVGEAVFTAQLMALYGRIFTNNSEPAFANNKLWESTGFVISFSYNNYICTDTKLIILMSVLLFAMVCFVGAEVVHRMELKQEDSTQDNREVIVKLTADIEGNGEIVKTEDVTL